MQLTFLVLSVVITATLGLPFLDAPLELFDHDYRLGRDSYKTFSSLFYNKQPSYIDEGDSVKITRSNSSIPPWELQALKDLYTSCNGIYWDWNGQGVKWDFSTYNESSAASNPCWGLWEGIQCSCNLKSNESTNHLSSQYGGIYYYYYDDDDGLPGNILDCHVEKIFLMHHNLTGTLPSSIGNFQNLTHLHLGFNALTADIPSTIFSPYVYSTASSIDTKALKVVSFFNNLFHSTVPPEIGLATNLLFLDLGACNLHGTLPSSIGFLNLLTIFYSDSNSFTGAIPSSMLQLSSLKLIHLPYNFFSGVLPNTISRMVGLKIFEANNNCLSGELPSTFGLLSSLIRTSIHENYFSGPLPSTFYLLENLIDFFCEYNTLSGSLSTEIGNLRNLQLLSLKFNAFTGTIPSTLRLVSNMTYLLLAGNYFTGAIPSTISDLVRMEIIDLHGNKLTSTIPSFLGSFSNLQLLRLGLNSLTGTIPTAIFQLPSLNAILLASNHLVGTIPFISLESSLQNLTILDISHNNLSGPLPDYLFRLPQLAVFSALSNCLTGTIPQSVCEASALLDLILDGMHTAVTCRAANILNIPKIFESSAYPLVNYYPGALPSCIFSLQNIQTFHFSGNGLVGLLNPYGVNEVRFGPNLRNLSLSHNLLTGSIPREFQLRSWVDLDLSFNKLTGILIPEMSLHHNSTLSLLVNRLSGDIPISLRDVTVVDILTGNLFACDSQRWPLPINDPKYSDYICGSDDLNTSFFVFSACIVGAVVTMILYIQFGRLRKKAHDDEGMQEKTRFSFRVHLEATYNDLKQWLSVFKVVPVNSIPTVSPPLSCYSSLFPSRDFIVRSAATESTLSAEKDSSSPNPSTSCATIGVAVDNSSGTVSTTSEISNVQVSKITSEFAEAFPFRAVVLFGFSMNGLRMAAFLSTALTFVLFTPTYLILHQYHSSFANTYGWFFSIAYLSGSTPAISLFVVLICHFVFLRIIYTVTVFRIHNSVKAALSTNCAQHNSQNKREMNSSYNKTNRASTYRHLASLALIFAINCVIVIGVNIGFVSAVVNRGGTQLFFITITVSFFKLFWTRVGIPWLLSIVMRNEVTSSSSTDGIHDDSDKLIRQASLQVFTACINNIVIPFLASLIVSPQCFKYALFDPPLVISGYEYLYCLNFGVDNSKVFCQNDELQVRESSFQPPFSYSYTCSSSVLSFYSAVFVYMLTTNALYTPFRCLIVYSIIKRMDRGSTLRNILTYLLPAPMRPFHEIPMLSMLLRQFLWESWQSLCRFKCRKSVQEQDRSFENTEADLDRDTITRASLVDIDGSPKRPVLDIEIFVAEIATSFFIIVTFGLAFPPLAILALFSILSQTYFTQLMVGRLYRKAEHRNLKYFIDWIDKDCRGIAGVLNQSLRIIFSLGFLFFSFFIYDIFGSNDQYWASVVMIAFPISFYFIKYLYRYLEEKFFSRQSIIPTRLLRCSMSLQHESAALDTSHTNIIPNVSGTCTVEMELTSRTTTSSTTNNPLHAI